MENSIYQSMSNLFDAANEFNLKARDLVSSIALEGSPAMLERSLDCVNTAAEASHRMKAIIKEIKEMIDPEDSAVE